MSAAITILFVDDDVMFQDLVRYSLARDSRFRMECVLSGSEALERLSHPGIDVILSDVMMPQMSGPDLLAAVRRQPGTKELPFIFMTAAAMSLKREDLTELGLLGVISKPFDPTDLAGQISRMIGLDADV